MRIFRLFNLHSVPSSELRFNNLFCYPQQTLFKSKQNSFQSAINDGAKKRGMNRTRARRKINTKNTFMFIMYGQPSAALRISDVGTRIESSWKWVITMKIIKNGLHRRAHAKCNELWSDQPLKRDTQIALSPSLAWLSRVITGSAMKRKAARAKQNKDQFGRPKRYFHAKSIIAIIGTKRISIETEVDWTSRIHHNLRSSHYRQLRAQQMKTKLFCCVYKRNWAFDGVAFPSTESIIIIPMAAAHGVNDAWTIEITSKSTRREARIVWLSANGNLCDDHELTSKEHDCTCKFRAANLRFVYAFRSVLIEQISPFSSIELDFE